MKENLPRSTLEELDGVVIVPLTEWEQMKLNIEKILARVSNLQAARFEGPAVLRRTTTEIITKKTIEEDIANDPNKALLFQMNMEAKVVLTKRLTQLKVDIANSEKEEAKELERRRKPEKIKVKTKKKKKGKEIKVHGR